MENSKHKVAIWIVEEKRESPEWLKEDKWFNDNTKERTFKTKKQKQIQTNKQNPTDKKE